MAALRGAPHHIELWVPDLAASAASWGWLLAELGWRSHQEWPAGRSWLHPAAGVHLVVEQSPALTAGRHERCRPGLNHLALHAGSRAQVDDLAARAPSHGWRLLFADRYPHAGGPDQYAAYLEDAAGYEAELVAEEEPRWAGRVLDRPGAGGEDRGGHEPEPGGSPGERHGP